MVINLSILHEKTGLPDAGQVAENGIELDLVARRHGDVHEVIAGLDAEDLFVQGSALRFDGEFHGREFVARLQVRIRAGLVALHGSAGAVQLINNLAPDCLDIPCFIDDRCVGSGDLYDDADVGIVFGYSRHVEECIALLKRVQNCLVVVELDDSRIHCGELIGVVEAVPLGQCVFDAEELVSVRAALNHADPGRGFICFHAVFSYSVSFSQISAMPLSAYPPASWSAASGSSIPAWLSRTVQSPSWLPPSPPHTR